MTLAGPTMRPKREGAVIRKRDGEGYQGNVGLLARKSLYGGI
jgi:hypothetical protein